MLISRRTVLAAIAGASLLAAFGPAAAETFPTRPITLVVPYPAGGPTDAIARIVAEDAGRRLGQTIVVKNEGGASGALGTKGVAHAEPDGYTIVFGNNQTHGNNMFLMANPGYDAVKDFYPLAGVGAFEHVFVVRTDLPAKTIPELIALAKKDPGKLNYGSTGIGSGSHLATELFMQRTGITMTHVPFRGAAPLVQELMAQRIDISNSTLPSVLGQIQGGAIRAIAIASPQRNPQLPDVPTLREQGVSDADANSWAAFFAPVRVPQPVLDKLSGAILASLKDPAVAQAIGKLGFTLDIREPKDFRPYHEREMETWKGIIDAAGVKGQ